ncbi:MAG: S8 family serine peptidase [Desulfovermiculus sp.]|nr:S8 family serine peptidase [Desulfovermiculus sp.]
MSWRFGIVFLIFFLFTDCGLTHALDRQALLKMADEYHQTFRDEKARAFEMANMLKLPVQGRLDDGRYYEIMRFEDNFPEYYITNNREGASLIKSSQIWPEGKADPSLTGSGQALGIWDSGAVRLTHEEFEGRAIQEDQPSFLSIHATHVGGTMVAAGIKPDAQGMSYQGALHAYDWDDDGSEMTLAATNGLLVSNHSYSSLVGWAYGDWSGTEEWHWWGDVSISSNEAYRFGFYDRTARDWDEISFNAPHYLIVKSAGNDRNDDYSGAHYYFNWKTKNWELSRKDREPDGGTNGYDSIPTYGNAKNILTVGAVDASKQMASFSGWGPSDDGRVKPDIVAKGINVFSASGDTNKSYALGSGTSMASPMISGSVGLLAEYQEKLYARNDPFWSSTMKALIIHAADDSINGAPGPDYRFGWGLMNTKKSAEIMTHDSQAGGQFHIRELTLDNGHDISIPVTSPGSKSLRATLAWTDPPGKPPKATLNPADKMLVNDLNLRIIDPQGKEIKPYVLDPAKPSQPAATGNNSIDNVEMVHIPNPEFGQKYIVKISHTGDLKEGYQNFSLIMTGIQATESLETAPGVFMLLLGDENE